MITAFLITLEQMGRILLFLILGFGLNRLRILPKETSAALSKLITMVLMPAILIYSNMTEFNLANVAEYGQLVLLGGLFVGIVVLLSHPVSRLLAGKNYADRGLYLYSLIFPNTGAVGTPLVLTLLGTVGYFQYNLFLLVTVILTYVWGIGLFLNTERKNPIKRFFVNMLNPVFISMFTGLVLGALGAKNWMPTLVMGALKDLSACYVPLSLLFTGYRVADYPLGEVFTHPRSYVFSLFRLIIIPALTILLAWVLRLPNTVATLVAFTFASPCGMNVVVFPASYGQDCRTGSSMVLLSSLASILTVPVIYALVQLLFP